MSKVILYCTADNHLDGRTNAALKETIVDPIVAFDELCQIVIDDEVEAGESKVLILAGDITDKSKVSLATVNCLASNFDRLREADVEILGIAGNHDMDPVISADKYKVTMLENGEAITRGEWKIVGINGNISASRMLEYAQSAEADLLVMHTAFREYLGFEGAYKIELDQIDQERVKNILVGDIHTPMAVDMENGFMLSPGSTFATDISVKRPFFVWRWEYGEKPVSIRLKCSRDVSVHTICTADDIVSVERNLESISKKLNPAGLLPYVRVSFIPEFSGAVASLEELYAGQILFHSINSPSLSLNVGRLSDGTSSLDIGEVTLMRALIESKEDIDEDVYDILAELLKHDDSSHDLEILKRMYKSFVSTNIDKPEPVKAKLLVPVVETESKVLPDLPALPELPNGGELC